MQRLAFMTLLLGLAVAQAAAKPVAGDHRALLRAAISARAADCVNPKLQPWVREPGRDDGWATRDNKMLSNAEGKALNAAMARARPGKAGPIAAAWLPQGIKLDDNPEHCREVVTFSQPAIAGNIGFVHVGSFCGPLCGSGMIHAYRKTGGRWIHVGSIGTWIS